MGHKYVMKLINETIMKKQIFSLAVVLLLNSAACMAQDKKGQRPDRSQRMEQMVTELGLNETQAKQFKEAMEEMRPANNKNGQRPSREEMEAKRKKSDEKIKSILTEEQYKKYQSMRSQGRQRRAK